MAERKDKGAVGKRIFDLVVATVLALLAVPLILVFAVALAVSLRAWPFFLQERIGQYGRSFRMLKLRTLPRTTPHYASKHSLDMSGLPVLCDWMRRNHLDELPQLFGVMAGQLSLVGPRPKMPDYAEAISPEFGKARVTVPQGCTGLWQIGEHRHLGVSEVAEYDLFYLENHTFRLDIWVLWRTALVMTKLGQGEGLDAVPGWALPENDTSISARMSRSTPATDAS